MNEKPFDKLVAIVAKLRDPNGGCPWDLEQTHQSLKPYVIEEAYEVIDAIDSDSESLKKELGDLLLQVVLHAQVAKDAGTFNIDDIVEILCEKLIKRHPHVFGDNETGGKVEAKTTKKVLENWEQIKQKELKKDESILDGVPKGMPALLRAQRVGEKAARVGFEWRETADVKAKVLEEIQEFLESDTIETNKDEFGDILFALTQLSRRLGLNSEDLLHTSTNKFTRRFKAMEKIVAGKVSDHTLEELDKIWEQVKMEE